MSLNIGGTSVSATANTDGSLSGSGATFNVQAYTATSSTAPGRFAGTYHANNQSYNQVTKRVDFDAGDGPITFVISGTPYATNRYYVSGSAVDTSNPGVVYVIQFAGTAVLLSSDVPSRLSSGTFLDVHTINLPIPVNMDGNYFSGHWAGGFSGGAADSQQGYVTGVYDAYGPR